MNDHAPAVLRDERDLLWLAVDDVRRRGRTLLMDLHYLARRAPSEPPEPFVSVFGVPEPEEGLAALLDSLLGAVRGEVSALRHDPVADGLSFELKARGEGRDRSFEVVLWLDLVRMNPAMKARAVRGRHQGGLRMFTTVDRLEAFREALFALAFPPEEQLD